MASVTTRSWTMVLVVAAVGLSLLLSLSPEAREQARQGGEQLGSLIIQFFASLGDFIRSALHVTVHF